MNRTIATYDKMAQKYHEETEFFWNNFPKSVIENFCSSLNGTKILNVGSGSGRDSIILRNRGLDVICVDASKSMVELTKNFGFETYQIDFMEMDFSTNSFDGVWAYTSLLHLSKKEARKVIQKIHSFLRPNGVFLLGMIQGTFKGYLQTPNWGNNKRYFRYYTNHELDDMVIPVGFKKIYTETYVPHARTYINNIYVKL